MSNMRFIFADGWARCVDGLRQGTGQRWGLYLLFGGLMCVATACGSLLEGTANLPENARIERTPSPAAESVTPTAQGASAAEASVQNDVARVSDFLQESVPVATAVAAADQPLTVAELMVKRTPAKTAAESTADARGNAAPRGTIDGTLVNLRGGPGTRYQTVGQVGAGEALEIVGRNEDGSWWLVCCPGDEETESWVRADLVALSPQSAADDARLEAVPLAEIPPTPEASAASAGVNASDTSAASLAAAPASGLPGPGGFGAPGGTNPLTGLALPGGRNGQRPVIVCINNDFAARPQFGTTNADVMYEYLMEGYGITRFSGVYYGEDSGQVGPVRSARLINYYMGALYDAGLTCSGASDPVRYLLKHDAPFPYLDIDLDDPSNARYSASIGTDYRTRLRTSTPQLHQWLTDWGVEKPASIRGFTFGELPGGGAGATSITVPYPSGSRSSYAYDGGSGRYLRSLGGAPHTDGNTGAQIAVDNVIVQYVPHETTDIVEDSLGSLSIRLNLFGSGRALLFRDGQAFDTTWRSDSRGDMPHFVGADGAEVPLKPGKTWISIVPLSYGIEYR